MTDELTHPELPGQNLSIVAVENGTTVLHDKAKPNAWIEADHTTPLGVNGWEQ